MQRHETDILIIGGGISAALLAEKLVELIPCAEMVRFGKNGSDATTGAIRLARAYTGRSKVAICGYHGWHDWYIGTTTRRLGVPQDKPMLLQVSRFDRFKDPVGVVEAYRLVKRSHDCRLVLAGGTATDDPEGAQVLAEVQQVVGTDPDVHILLLPPTANLEINALQRAATIVIQKSTREGFGLTVAEALWKGKPVIGGETGGITVQVIPGRTGYTVNSPEGAAFYIKRLLNEPEQIAEMQRLVDEAMLAVIGGELSPIATGLVYCNTIAFCREVHELSRAREWTAALTRWCEQQPDMVAHTGLCLVHRAEIMELGGAWPDALTEARHAAERFAAGMSRQRVTGYALYRQGEVHRLRGAFDAADAAYREASRYGREPQPGLALLRMAQGERSLEDPEQRRP